MNNNEIDLYKGNRSSGIVKSNGGNNQTDIVTSNQDSEINYLSRLTPEQLQKCKRIHNRALVYCGDYAIENKQTGISTEDRVKIAAASRAESKPATYLKDDGVLQTRFGNESQGKRTKSKKKSAKEEQQIATDNLILELKTQKQVIKDYLSGERLGEPEREIIKDILDEEAAEYSTFEDIESILKNYLIYLKQKIESLDKISRDNDYRKRIHKKQVYRRDLKCKDEAVQAILWSWNGKVPTLERIAEHIIERDNDTKALELLALNQYQGSIAELIEVFVISRGEMVIGEHHDNIQMMLVPIDVEDIGAFVAEQNTGLVPYLHPAYEESDDRYALTAFSPINNMVVDIRKSESGILSADGFNGYRSTNPNNQLLLEQAQSNVVEAKLLSAASSVKQLPAAEGAEGNNDDSDNSLAIVLADNKENSALDIIPVPELVSTLDVLETDEEVLSLTLTNPVEVLSAIIIEDNLEQRNNSGWIVKSTGEEVFHSSCKNLASKVIKKTKKIEPLFFGQLVEGDGSYYDHVNNTTRVYIANTGETVTYSGLVKLRKFASDEEVSVDEAKVLKATIKNAANIAEATQYDGPGLQSLKNDYQLTVPIAQDIIRTYWNIEQNNKTCASNTVLSEKEYEAYCQSRDYGKESNIIRESDLLSVSESSIESLKNFLEYIDDTESAKSIAIKKLETLLSAITKEQEQILDTPPEEISDLISKITQKSNEIENINREITDIVNQILQKHYQCDLDKALEILALYPAIETIFDIGTEEDDEHENFQLPSDIWTNQDYRYESWNGQRNSLPFPSKKDYQKFIRFIKNIEGKDESIIRDSIMLTIDLEIAIKLLDSNDLEAAKEFQAKIDNEAKSKAQRKIEESTLNRDNVKSQGDLASNLTQELLNIDIQIDKDIKNDSEAELLDLDFADPTINISGKDLETLEEILQSKLSDKRLPLKHKMVWRKFFESVAYEQIDAETINEKLTKARHLLNRS